MSCCGGIIPRSFIDSMCESVQQAERFQKKFVIEFEQDSTRKILKMITKQYHVDEIAYSGDRGWHFDPSSGEMVDWNTGFKYLIRYWHFDPKYSDRPDGKVKHFYCF